MSSRSVTKLLHKGLGSKCTRNFSLHKLPEQHMVLQDVARKYAREKLKPIAGQLDKEHKFPAKQVQELGQLGFMSVEVGEKWGGSGYDTLALSVIVEEISRACGGTGAIVSIHNSLYVNLVDRVGSDQQKEVFLKPFTKGTLGCFALSEPFAGSDVGSLLTTARLDGDYYVLNGTKSWVTGASEAKAAVVFATIDSNLKHKGITGFLVAIPSEGLTLGKNDDKLGIRAAPTCNLILEDVRVPKENVLGDVGDGFKLAMAQLDRARVGIASQAIGIGQAAFEVAIEYSAQRKAFGSPINQLQAVKLRLADMALKLESARLLVRRAAVMCGETERSTKASSMAKLAASTAATFISHNAVQILGGMGYVSNMPAERHFRDARITEIYGGVTDIQRLLIGELVIKESEENLYF